MLKRLLLVLCFLFSATSLMAVGSISGIVTTALGVPLPGVTVTVLRGGNTVVSTTTEGDGSYSFGGIPAGEYVVRASLLTFQTAIAGVTVLDGQNSVANFSLAANPGAVSGQVLDDGTMLPIVGATVSAIQNDVLIGTATTNGSGNYTINGLAPGSYIVTGSASSYQADATGAAVLAGQTTTVNFSLVANPGTISGTVTGAVSSLPISDALIEVSLDNTVIFSTVTDGSGGYSISGISPGSYVVQASAPNYQSDAIGAIVLAGQTETVDFALEPNPGTITGTVIGAESGLPISGALIEVNSGSVTVGSAITDNSGNYSILGVAPGSYVVDAYATNYQDGTAGVIMLAGQTKTVNFSLQPDPGTMIGTVTGAVGGLPISGASVHVIYEDILIDSTLTDSFGNYTVTGLVPGSYTVTASKTNYDTGITGAIVSAGQTTTVDFALEPNPGTISGTVTGAVSSLPISGALIQVSLDNTVIFSTLTDGSGDYSISGVSPGSYIVRASASNYQSDAVGAIVLAGQTTTADFALEPDPGTIAGTVIGAVSGLPISGARIEVNLAGITVGSGITDSSGDYSISGIAPGTYIVDAYAANYQTGTAGIIMLAGQTKTADFALEPNPGTISGTITGAVSGLPISGASVRAIYEDTVVGSVLTDSSGNYSLTGLVPGSYTVTASKVNYDTGVTGAIVSAGQTTTVDFALEPNPGTIAGTVTGAVSSLPISGALIQVSLDNTIIFSTLTDSVGDYSISGLSPGSYIVQASASNYQSDAAGAIVLAGQTTTVDFALEPNPGTITGTVIGAVSGLPISGALIEVHLAGITISSAITDNSGSYSITGIAPGSYIVHAYATNYQAISVGVIMLAGQTKTANFSLAPNPGTITGTVTGAISGLPISGASIQVIYEDTVIESTLTDSFGDYTVMGLSPGSYTVTASKTNYDTGVTGAIVSAGQTAEADFALEPNPGTISGTVIGAISSLPISGALIEVSSGSTIVFSTLTDNSGDYSIVGVSPGSYVVQARAANYQSGARGAIVLAGQTTTVDFALQPNPGTISGVVIGAVSGLPISGALVEVSLVGIAVGSGITDSSGNYSIPGMAPGSYIVEASSPNYQTDTIGVIMTAGQTKTTNFALEPNPGTFSGKVIRTSTGMPISGASIHVSHDNVTIDSALTDSAGNYSISGIPPGSYTLDAYAVNYQSGTSTSTISANQTKTVNFSLQSSPGTISGTVTSAMGSTPIAGALVEVNLNNSLIFSTLTDSAGNYSISGVAPNTYAVHAHATTYQTAINNSVVVTANMTTTVNFSLQSNPGAVEGTVTNSVTGLPLPGVFIDIFEGGVFIDATVTDSSGNYSVTGLATDNYTLTANKTNYETRDASFSVIAGNTTTLNFTLIPNFPPRNLTGSVIVNAFLLQADRIHHLQWDSALGGNIASYRVYRNGAFLSNVSPNGPLQYDDHNRIAKVQDNYSVTAVNTSGSESSSVSIALQ